MRIVGSSQGNSRAYSTTTPIFLLFFLKMKLQAMTTITQASAAAIMDRRKLVLMPPRVASLENRPEMDPTRVL